jgi:hypothetical protein
MSAAEARLDQLEANDAPGEFTVLGTRTEFVPESSRGQFCVDFIAFGETRTTCIPFAAGATDDANRCREDVRVGDALPESCR